MNLNDNHLPGDRAAFEELFLALCAVPAPSLNEGARTDFILRWLREAGLSRACADQAGNVLVPWNLTEDTRDFPLYLAHIDVVFPDTAPLPVTREANRIVAPGCGDDTACAAMLMDFLARLCHEPTLYPTPALFAFNVGEEGLGNLAGCRRIFADYAGRIREAVSFDGGVDGICNRAVGSGRYRITARAAGGHSYNQFGNANAIAILCGLIHRLYTLEPPAGSRSTYNVGTITGGTSVNTIAPSCSCLFEYRSDCREHLSAMDAFFHRTIQAVQAALPADASLDLVCVGERPCMGNPDPAALERLTGEALLALSAAGFSDVPVGSGSTDCNIPLSLDIPAICFGGLMGGGVHTRGEYVELPRLYAMRRAIWDFLLRRGK